jgi:hypothetical protein
MTEKPFRKYGGWHGVCDPSHILICISYDPTGQILACKMNTGEPILHEGVPERIAGILLRSAYAGSYYRKYVARQYPIIGKVFITPIPDDKEAMAKKREALKKKRMASIPKVEQTLFGPIPIRKHQPHRKERYYE